MKFTSGRMLTIAIATVFASSAFAGGGEKEKDKSAVDAEIRIMDSDIDGKVSAAEHAAAAQQMFQGMDGNQDNRVTSVEMDAAEKPMKTQGATHGEHGSESAKQLSSADKIKKIDTDGDGVLTAQEHIAGSKKMFSMMDADKDGFLTAAEIKSGQRELMSND